MRWGVVGASSRIYRKSLQPGIELAGHQIVAEAVRSGDSLAPYDEMLARTDVDAVYVPLPNHLHAEWIHRALDAGKHVLCEKPLTMSVADTVSVFDHAEQVGRTVLEAYMWPHHPRARRLLELVAAGEVGWPQSGRAQFSWPMDLTSGDHRLDLRGAGALFDVGIYCIAPFMLMARRDPAMAAANATRNTLGVDIEMTGWIDWSGGFGSSFHVSFDAPSARHLALSASEGLVTVVGDNTPGSSEPSDLVIERRDGSIDTITCEGGDAFEGLVHQFEAVVRGEAPAVFGRTESVRLATIIEGLHQSSAH